MKKLIKIVIIVLLLLAFETTKSQVKINRGVLPNEPIEKITINTDRNFYLSGERIWFNAHINSKNKADSVISKVLYVELFNHSKSALVRHKFKIENGFSEGTIEIPKIFLSDNYFLRAYTQLLRNYPPETYFTSLLTIIDPTKPLPLNATELSTNQIDLIPEFGFLLDGIGSKIAFRVHNHVNLIKSISIIDNQRNVIANPPFTKNGMGLFEITPQKNVKYFLSLIYSNNDTITKPLPIAHSEGITIKNIREETDEYIVSFTQKFSNPIERSKNEYQLHISSETNKIIHKTQITLLNETTNFKIQKQILSPGLNHLSLKNSSGNTMINFVLFQNDSNELLVELAEGKQSFGRRELINLRIKPKIINSGTIDNLSVSVIKKGAYTKLPVQIFDNPELLKSYLINNDQFLLDELQKSILQIYYNKLLSSNIKEEQSSNEIPIIYEWLPEIRDVSISGIVYDKLSMKPKSNIPIFLSVIKNNPQVHVNSSKKDGEYIFSLNNVESNQDIFLCPISQYADEFEIKINSDFSNSYPKLDALSLTVNESHELLLKEMWINQQTNDLYKVKLSSKQKPKYQYPINLMQPPITILTSDFIDLNSLEVVFREIVPHCLIRRKNNRLNIHLVDVLNSFQTEDPLILIDNIPIFDDTELLKVHPSKIEKIEVYPYNLVLGEFVIGGLIKLTTNTMDFGGIEMPKGSTFLEYQAITPTYNFTAPNYSIHDSGLEKIADFRTILYWNPSLNISNDKSISFYSSDHCSEYDVIIRGITSEGKKYYGQTSFTVK